MRAAIYARVSTVDQEPENQLQELRRYVEARVWAATEYVDRGVSGARDRRAALDRLMADARKRRIDAVVVWKLDRLGRSLRHLILTIEELTSLGVTFTSLGEGIDTGTPTGRLQLHLLGAVAEFERERIRERVLAGLQRAKSQGKRLGRPRRELPPEVIQIAQSRDLSVEQAAEQLGVSGSTVKRWRRQVQKTLSLSA